MLHWVDRWQTKNIRSFAPKKEVVDDFVEHVDTYMQCTVWTEDCSCGPAVRCISWR